MSQYQQQTPPQPYPMQMMQSPEMMQGQKHAQTSLIFGILGLFVLGIVFGPLAISQANKAERLHQAATAGKVLGWISLIFGILGLVWFVIMMGTMVAAMNSYSG
ncbi:hypothetical protein ACFQ36_18345 [Arthrobacter sp. GCM10027362]|uniref:hypothetical protein n=1 Tax=Arthrobacter sp. GCM10027362 TaxID=3273379 RepID=UPI003636B2A2